MSRIHGNGALVCRGEARGEVVAGRGAPRPLAYTYRALRAATYS